MKILETIIKNFIKGKTAGKETAKPKEEEKPKQSVLVPYYSDGLIALNDDDGMDQFCIYCEALSENNLKVTRSFIPPKSYSKIFYELYSAGAIRGIGGGEVAPNPFRDGKQSLLAIQHPVTKEPVLVYTVNPESKPVG